MNYRVEKDFEYKGFRCAVVAQSMGHRCGYVQIPKGHPFERPYQEVDEVVNVHGGLTYGRMSNSYPVETEKNSYWLGFDCAHYRDAIDVDILQCLNPQLYDFYKKHCSEKGHVWTADEVATEIQQLVNQIL